MECHPRAVCRFLRSKEIITKLSLQKLKILKIDTFYPISYLNNKQKIDKAKINKYNYEEYYLWLMSQRSYLSDYFTKPMNDFGWEAREFISHDNIQLKKLINAGEINFSLIDVLIHVIYRIATSKIYKLFTLHEWVLIFDLKYFYLKKYISSYNPDIIFLREPTLLDGNFFARYKGKNFIITLIGCPLKHANNFIIERSDLILTLTKEYRDFFKTQGTDSEIIEYGVDRRIDSEIEFREKLFDCVFVGMLGSNEQKSKSELLEHIASKGFLKWWGLKGDKMELYPNLLKCYQGETSGIEMFKIYKSAKIVINDYVNMANDFNVNLRTKEVLSVGSFLLTRHNKNLNHLGNVYFGTFTDNVDCLNKIIYYLANESIREKIALEGKLMALKEWNYNKIILDLMGKISQYHSNWQIARKDEEVKYSWWKNKIYY